MKQLSALLIGLLFGLGLIVSGMINPAKVIGFLDIFGQWDASLAFVMGGAVVVSAIGFRVLKQLQKAPVFDLTFNMPTRKDIDSSLLTGSLLFGVGWGLVGLCPGPAIAALTAAPSATWIFFASLFSGMGIARAVTKQ